MKKHLEEYRLAPSGEGCHSNVWKDKPHRLIYDLVNIASELYEENEKLSRMLREYVDQYGELKK